MRESAAAAVAMAYTLAVSTVLMFAVACTQHTSTRHINKLVSERTGVYTPGWR
jgi:hypothetical protein